MGEVIRKVKGGRFIGWYLRYIDADGRRKQRASHQPSFAEARRMLIEIEGRIVRGAVGMEVRPTEGLCVGELFNRFTAEYSNPRLKDIAAYRRQARTVLVRMTQKAPQFARLPLASLTPSHIRKTQDALSQRYPPGTVRTSMIVLSSALSWAVREELIEKNPAHGVERPPSPAPRLDFLSVDEVRRLLAEAERRARTESGRESIAWWSRWVGMSLAIRTGARKGEVFGLRWQDVDLDRQRLTIARSYGKLPKSGKVRHLRLPSALVPLLREWRTRCPQTDVICPVYCQGSWNMALDTSCDHGMRALLQGAECRVLPRPWHLLRHTFGSYFVMNGGSLVALSQILGHSDVKTTQIYAHLSSDFLDGEMEKVKF